MKQLLFVILVLFMSATGVLAQTKVKLDSLGNYVSNTSTYAGSKIIAQTTGKYFIDSKGARYPVWKSSNNNLYYLKAAKSGNVYKVYLKTK